MNPRVDHEVVCGVTITVLAAILAITDLASTRFGDQEIALITERASTYAWSGQKGLEISVQRSQKLLLEALLQSDNVEEAAVPILLGTLERTESSIELLKKQRDEIELGSEAVGEANWSLRMSGGYGKVEGAREQRRRLGVLGRAVDRFGLAQVLLQVGLVLGAISLVFKGPALRWRFFQLMCLLGVIGVICAAWAWAIASGA